MKSSTAFGLCSLVLILSLVGLASCGGEDLGTQANLNHADGFDFSDGSACTSDDQSNGTCDGDAVGFSPNGTGTATSTESNPIVWFRANAQPTYNDPNPVKDLGAISLGDVSQASIPTTWPTEPDPIVVGHVYIVECMDGWAAFVVESLSDNPYSDWDFDVRYIYSADGTFQ